MEDKTGGERDIDFIHVDPHSSSTRWMLPKADSSSSLSDASLPPPPDPMKRQKQMIEEVGGMQSYERKISPSVPLDDSNGEIDENGNRTLSRQYSKNTYTERRTYGRDENGELVIRIESQPSSPVRPVTPVEPLTPLHDEAPLSHGSGTFRGSHFSSSHRSSPVGEGNLRPASAKEVRFLQPRTNGQTRDPSARHDLRAPHSRGVPDPTGDSRASSGFHSASPAPPLSPQQSQLPPMRKIIKKSRLVSVHDGRPLSDFVETIYYEPVEHWDCATSFSARESWSLRDGYSGGHRKQETTESRSVPRATGVVTFNPLYQD